MSDKKEVIIILAIILFLALVFLLPFALYIKYEGESSKACIEQGRTFVKEMCVESVKGGNGE